MEGLQRNRAGVHAAAAVTEKGSRKDAAKPL
jgi:hypothetical protein